MANRIIKYRFDLKKRAQEFRKNLTPAEKILWKHIRKKSLGVEFHRQVPLLDYIVDFYCHEIGLVIEVDGSTHEHSFIEDSKRQNRLENEGLRFLRFKNESIFNELESVIEEIQIKIIDLSK
ncbi:MAG TPA: DNA methylase [Flavobacteriaceae bacterium]|nr:DNA methylase [Flavobacteriaceae bacterium]HAT66125.1 DNA methylase [Flavobacteriaceae bacterium]|tara:strand:+ start:437 stop:802 length:366 start_codon:yes stop_codon:yes gene_type:complete